MARAIAHPGGDDRLDAEVVPRWSRHVSVSCRTGVFLSLGYRRNRSYDGQSPSQEARQTHIQPEPGRAPVNFGYPTEPE